MFAGTFSQFPKRESTVSDLQIIDWNSITIPTTGMTSGLRWGNGRLRTDLEYHQSGLTFTTLNGSRWLRSWVNPTSTPAPNYSYRAEFTEWPWPMDNVLGVEEWIGFSYKVPNDHVGIGTGCNIFQYHPSGGPELTGDTSTSPNIALEIAYAGQLNSSTIYRKTPTDGYIQFICNPRGGRERWVHPNAPRWLPGARLDFVLQIISHTGSTGLFRTWINGTLYQHTGYTSSSIYYPPGGTGSTVFHAPTYQNKFWSPNFKLGLYHQGLKDGSGVAANAAVGHYEMTAYLSTVKRLRRMPWHPDYRKNAFSVVDTSSYP
jgi:hypothetical protein